MKITLDAVSVADTNPYVVIFSKSCVGIEFLSLPKHPLTESNGFFPVLSQRVCVISTTAQSKRRNRTSSSSFNGLLFSGKGKPDCLWEFSKMLKLAFRVSRDCVSNRLKQLPRSIIAPTTASFLIFALPRAGFFFS